MGPWRRRQDSMGRWHYLRDGAVHGPFSDAEILRLARTGELRPTDSVTSDRLHDWLPARDVTGIEFGDRQATAKPTPEPGGRRIRVRSRKGTRGPGAPARASTVAPQSPTGPSEEPPGGAAANTLAAREGGGPRPPAPREESGGVGTQPPAKPPRDGGADRRGAAPFSVPPVPLPPRRKAIRAQQASVTPPVPPARPPPSGDARRPAVAPDIPGTPSETAVPSGEEGGPPELTGTGGTPGPGAADPVPVERLTGRESPAADTGRTEECPDSTVPQEAKASARGESMTVAPGLASEPLSAPVSPLADRLPPLLAAFVPVRSARAAYLIGAPISLVVFLALLLHALDIDLRRRPAVTWDAERVLSHAETVARFLAEQTPDAHVLVVTHPPGTTPGIPDIEEAFVRDVFKAAGSKVTLKATDRPKLPSHVARHLGAEGADLPGGWLPPLRFWYSAVVLQGVIREHPECDLVLSLVGLPNDFERLALRGERRGRKPRIIAVGGSAAGLREALRAGVIVAGLAPLGEPSGQGADSDSPLVRIATADCRLLTVEDVKEPGKE